MYKIILLTHLASKFYWSSHTEKLPLEKIITGQKNALESKQSKGWKKLYYFFKSVTSCFFQLRH